jgi:hypothetical protein
MSLAAIESCKEIVSVGECDGPACFLDLQSVLDRLLAPTR